jgi:hypothetical protein
MWAEALGDRHRVRPGPRDDEQGQRRGAQQQQAGEQPQAPALSEDHPRGETGRHPRDHHAQQRLRLAARELLQRQGPAHDRAEVERRHGAERV